MAKFEISGKDRQVRRTRAAGSRCNRTYGGRTLRRRRGPGRSPSPHPRVVEDDRGHHLCERWHPSCRPRPVPRAGRRGPSPEERDRPPTPPPARPSPARRRCAPTRPTSARRRRPADADHVRSVRHLFPVVDRVEGAACQQPVAQPLLRRPLRLRVRASSGLTDGRRTNSLMKATISSARASTIASTRSRPTFQRPLARQRSLAFSRRNPRRAA